MGYSQEVKAAALDRLDEQAGNFRQASRLSGIPVDTLRRWAKQREQQRTEAALVALGENVEILRERTNGQTQHADDGKDPLLQVKEQMLSSALILAESLGKGIDETPLNHRANALNQLIDKIIKMAELLPEANEQVIRIEYLDPDGSIHSTPYWARDDSET